MKNDPYFLIYYYSKSYSFSKSAIQKFKYMFRQKGLLDLLEIQFEFQNCLSAFEIYNKNNEL